MQRGAAITEAPWAAPSLPPEPAYPLSVEQYYQMLDAGMLPDEEKVELLEGWLIPTMPHNPPHDVCVGLLEDALREILPRGWTLRTQGSVRLADSVPIPDGAVVRGGRRDFTERHPEPSQIGLLIEVSDTTLRRDTGSKKRIYARARIRVYWVVNLQSRQVEVFSEPAGTVKQPKYRKRRVYGESELIPVLLDGREIGRIAVADLLP